MKETTKQVSSNEASLEKLIETEVLKVESLHPGGLELTQELARFCKIEPGTAVLDVASGTGETACFLSERFDAHVIGVDLSSKMIRRAEEKANARALNFVEFQRADASQLPFSDVAFDVVICECTLCLFDKEKVLREMARVVKPGGRVGMHDLCWKENAPDDLRRTLSEIEGERPESLEGWSRLFREADLIEIIAVDKSDLLPVWMKNARQQLGLIGQGMLALKILRRWGIRGLWRVLRSERVFASKHLGYGIVVGTK